MLLHIFTREGVKLTNWSCGVQLSQEGMTSCVALWCILVDVSSTKSAPVFNKCVVESAGDIVQDCHQRVQLHSHHVTGLAEQFVESVGIRYLSLLPQHATTKKIADLTLTLIEYGQEYRPTC